jgi:hypothetical protein
VRWRPSRRSSRRGPRRMSVENSVAGAGAPLGERRLWWQERKHAPHAHDAAASPGAMAQTAWWSNRPTWKPSPVTSSVGVHRVELRCVRPWVGAVRSSVSHTSYGRQPQLTAREAMKPLRRDLNACNCNESTLHVVLSFL